MTDMEILSQDDFKPSDGPKPKAELKDKAKEVLRGLWASLFYSGRMTGKNLLICSAGSGEGSSTIAAGLAIAGSQPSGVARVALLDFNLRQPSLDKMFGLKKSPGVGEIIMGQAAPETAAQRVGGGLDVYTVGNAPAKVLDVLRAEAVSAFLATLSQGYDYVIIDAAPVNQFPDAQVLAGVVGNVRQFRLKLR